MRGPRNLLWQLPLAAVVAVPLWWGALAGFLAPPVGVTTGRAAAEPRPQVFIMDGVRFSQYRNGVEDWKINSRHVSSPNGGEILFLDGVDAKLLRDGATLFHIVGKAGRYDQQKQELGIAGNVTVQHRRGGVLSTEQLYYLDGIDKIRTPAKVRMVGDGLKVRGKGFEYDLKTDAYRVGGRVKVEVE